MLKNNNNCSNIYTVDEICSLYCINKDNLFRYLRQINILHSDRYLDVCGKKRKNLNYNLPKKDYNHMFKIKRQKGKNGFVNYKLMLTEQGKTFVRDVKSFL